MGALAEGRHEACPYDALRLVIELRKVWADGLPPPGSAFTMRNAG